MTLRKLNGRHCRHRARSVRNHRCARAGRRSPRADVFQVKLSLIRDLNWVVGFGEGKERSMTRNDSDSLY
jgi:hypothetical protein